MDGLTFIMKEKPKDKEYFKSRLIYRYDYVKPKVSTIIYLDIFDYDICNISFFTKDSGNDKVKFNLRYNYSGQHVLHIFRACLYVYKIYQNENNCICALAFHASNDIDKKNEEDNKRYSAYSKFLSSNLDNFDTHYIVYGEMKLNIQILTPIDHQNINMVKTFYEQYKDKVNTEVSYPEDKTK